MSDGRRDYDGYVSMRPAGQSQGFWPLRRKPSSTALHLDLTLAQEVQSSYSKGKIERLSTKSLEALQSQDPDVELQKPSDVVQFSESVAVVHANAGQLTVGVMRIGQCKGACTCTWTTVGGSAEAGKQFVESSGTISMRPGENASSISIPIICDPNWNATKEFRIIIENPENCVLGMYLKVLRVKIIDANVFPSNEFREQLEAEDEDINEFLLFASFLKLLWHQDGVQWRTILLVTIGLLQNAYEYMCLLLSVYIVDKVFNFHADEQTLYIPGNRLLTAYVIALTIFVPKVFFFAANHLEVQMNLNGRLRALMQKSLFRKFMNYNAKSRDRVALADMMCSLSEDVGSVSHGYTRTLHMLRNAGSISIAIVFTLHKNPGVWWAVLSAPCIMAFWAKVRTRKFIVASEAEDEKESKLLHFSNMALSQMNVIGAYRQRPQMNEYFEEKVNSLSHESISANTVTVNNESVPELMGPTLIALYSLIGATLVLNNELGLGTYLATISVFGSICKNFAEFFRVAMHIIETLPLLKSLALLLNMETELPAMQAASAVTAEKTKELRASMPDGEVPRVDRMDIEVRDVAFKYDQKLVFTGLNFSAPQGHIISLKSISGGGRKTLLDLLAGSIYPTRGTIFIPSHLRVLTISREICILDLSIWQNLTFGNKQGNNPYRVEAILKHFKMDIVLTDPKFMADLQSRKAEFSGSDASMEEEVSDNVHETNPLFKFREADQALIHLIRGLIMNPEVMLLHRPFVHFHDDEIQDDMVEALLGQKNNRGFKMPRENMLNRRPRTIFMSCDEHKDQERIKDIEWQLPDPSLYGRRMSRRFSATGNLMSACNEQTIGA